MTRKKKQQKTRYYTSKTRTNGLFSYTEIRRVGPDYPVALGTGSPPFEKIKPYLSNFRLARPGDKLKLPKR